MSESLLNPSDFLQGGKVLIHPATFSVIQASGISDNCLAFIRDHQEMTIIAQSGLTPAHLIVKEESDWRLLTFDMTLPFELVGFLAVVAKVLAEERISIFALSAYSTDHILVKKEHLLKTVEKLESLGCRCAEMDSFAS